MTFGLGAEQVPPNAPKLKRRPPTLVEVEAPVRSWSTHQT